MGKIHQLSDQTINQIAAGEVVDRPISVVKELVENSLDAEADRIEITIDDGGRTLIQIRDNGNGMSLEDLENSVKRHFTSKISETDDLMNIASFGFRGEALASISSVSAFSIASKSSESDEGYIIRVDEAGDIDVSPHGMPMGTEVTVKDLFYNVPAREKFLKTPQTEFSHIAELVYQLALVHPTVSFVLKKNGKEHFKTVGDGKVGSVLETLLGSELAKQMVPIHSDDPHVKVTGYIGKPGTGSASRPKQYVFVNGRPIDNKTIWKAVMQGYESYLGRHERPQFVIFIDIAPHLVDVNVHPQKKEVKFLSDGHVFQLVKQAVGKAVVGVSSFSIGQPAQEVDITQTRESSPLINSSNQASPMRSAGSWSPPATSPHSAMQPPSRIFEPKQSYSQSSSPQQEKPLTRKLFQIHNLFIIEETDDGMNVYDQHAVHERVLYERVVNDFLSDTVHHTQLLLVPLELALSEVEKSIFNEQREVFEKIGFGFEEKNGIFSIIQVPSAVKDNDLAEIVKEMLGEMSDLPEEYASEVDNVDNQTHRRLAYIACRSAIKAGDPLTMLEMEGLINDFNACTHRMTCPHGRPVQVTVSRSEMEKWFKRT